ncbi:MAG: amidohydrolase family protein [Hyphomicrobiaceae bacterium]
MRVVALEEHFTVPSLVSRIPEEAKIKRGFRPRTVLPGHKSPLDLLPDLGEERLSAMDAAGITVQVISMSAAGADLVDGQAGVDLAAALNDVLAGAVKKHPDRFAGFAHLPMRSPDACARELERAVKQLGFHGAMINGTCEDKFLDDPRYDSLLAAAAALDVPIYIHPSLAPEAVRNTYYSNLPGSASTAIETAGWGWHSETAIHVLRLVLSGALDKHRNLKVVIGHMGEGLPVMLARIDDVSAPHVRHLSRTISQTILDQVWITTSGVFTQPPLVAALMTFGLDRIMFSVDYPYSSNMQGKAFLDQLAFSPADMAKFTHGTADKLLKLKAG